MGELEQAFFFGDPLHQRRSHRRRQRFRPLLRRRVPQCGDSLRVPHAGARYGHVPGPVDVQVEEERGFSQSRLLTVTTRFRT